MMILSFVNPQNCSNDRNIKSESKVDALYKKALQVGRSDEGAPGVRGDEGRTCIEPQSRSPPHLNRCGGFQTLWICGCLRLAGNRQSGTLNEVTADHGAVPDHHVVAALDGGLIDAVVTLDLVAEYRVSRTILLGRG